MRADKLPEGDVFLHRLRDVVEDAASGHEEAEALRPRVVRQADLGRIFSV
jgi:hypothetical protein